jgi:N-acetylmuramoyl-L-alanine amidase
MQAEQRSPNGIAPNSIPENAIAQRDTTRNTTAASTQIESIVVTDKGVFVQTSGSPADTEVDRSPSRNSLELNIRNAAPSSRLSRRVWAINQGGIERLDLETRTVRGSSQVRLILRMQQNATPLSVTSRDDAGIGIYPQTSSYRALRNSLPELPAPAPVATVPDREPQQEESSNRPEPNRPEPPRRPSLVLPPRPSSPTPPVARPPIAPRPSAPLPSIGSGRVVVVVDPGHGGGDVGAVGIGGIQEAGINLDISRKVAAILEEQGVQAVLTRNSDVEIDLAPRVALAEQVNADLFVSIHSNAINMSRPDVNGIETYFYDSGEGLAESIHSSVVSATGSRDRGLRSTGFYVLKRTSMPAVLVEVGFVTGAEDQPRLADPNYRDQMAEAIARGILNYIQRAR